MRSPAALLAGEMVTALRELSPESRLEALALATAEIMLLAPNHSGGDATSLIEAYVGRLTATVREGLKTKTAATFPRRVALTAPLLDHLRDWLANEPPGKLHIVLEDHGDYGALLLLFWMVEGRPALFASNFYADRRGALEGLNRDVLVAAGLPPIQYTKKLEWRLPKSARDKRQRGHGEAPLP
ncbi:hypothetical protein X739_07460 [Mesorhizobium sp. LNHC220B00]|nr:hypothetical protein X741_34025 [Mesorhizobium sp. LNHC229A00]ESY88060.1 hypothetical protein X739_07460 [Mesorhizobium sp. LNHC220B00]